MARPFLSFTAALVAAVLILIGAGATPASAQPAPSATAAQPRKYPELDEALQYLRTTGDLPGTIAKVDKALRLYPELPSSSVLMFNWLAQLKQPNAARFQLEVAVHRFPNDPEPWVLLGNIALQERRVAEATMDFEKAKQLLAKYTNEDRKGPMEQQTMSGIAQVAEIAEDWPEAELRLRDLLKIAPEDLLAHQRLARAQFQQSGRSKAEAAYKTLKEAKEIAVRKKQPFLTPEAIMARFYDEAEGPEGKQADIWFRAALRRAPNDLPTRREVAVWALDNGHLDFAKEQADAALRIEKEDRNLAGSSVGHMLRGLVALWEKDFPEAENNFQAIILENPNDFSAKNNLALALAEQENPDKQRRALAYAESNYRENQNNADALSTFGWVYFKRKEFDQAGLCLQEAVKAAGGKMNSDMATYVAHILYHQERKFEAKQLLTNVMKNKRPFSMKKEALILWEKVKDVKPPETSTPTAPTK